MNLFQSIGKFIRKLFRASHDVIESAVVPAMKIIDVVRAVLENPAIDFITALTKTDKDNQLVTAARRWLPEIAEAWGIVRDARTKTIEEVLSGIMNHLNGLPEITRHRLYREIAAELAECLSDGELTVSESIVVVQLYFDEKYRESEERAGVYELVRSAA